MSLIIAIKSPIVGSQGYDALTRMVAKLARDAGGEVLSMGCLASLLAAASDGGILAKTYVIKAAAEATGGTILSMSCLHQLVNDNWQ